MKKILFIILILFITSFALPIQTSWYCQGFKVGYCEGWKEVKGQFAVCPVPPVCPVPEINKTKYKHGYNRGFIIGYKLAKNDNF